MASIRKKMLGKKGRARMRKTKTVKTATKTSIDSLPGHVQKRRVYCGKSNCRCVFDNERHAAFYHVFVENGRRVQRYVRRKDVETIRAACLKNRKFQDELRRGRKEYLQTLNQMRGLLKRIF